LAWLRKHVVAHEIDSTRSGMIKATRLWLKTDARAVGLLSTLNMIVLPMAAATVEVVATSAT